MLKRSLRGGSLLLGGEAVVQACGFLRNLIVARAVSPEDFGIASALAMTVTLIEAFSDLGAGRYLTRSGLDDPGRWVGTAHLLAAARGLMGGVALFLVAGPLAALLSMGEQAWAFRVIALVPVIRGFIHHSVWRDQQELRYGRFVAFQAIPQVLTLAAAYPLSRALPDFRCMLVLVIASAVVSLVASHVRSAYPYGVVFDRQRLATLGRYGFPLIADGLLMFAIMNGERMVFANQFGATATGVYSVALLLAWTPAGVIGRVALSLGVPMIGTRYTPQEAMSVLLTAGGLTACCLAVGLGVTSGDLPVALFGADYRPQEFMMPVLAAVYGVRILRAAPIVTSLAVGRTGQIVISNLIRAIGLPVGLGAAIMTDQMLPLLAAGLVFEVLALMYHVFVADGSSAALRVAAAGLVAGVIGLALGGEFLMSAAQAGLWARVGVASLTVGAIAAVAVYYGRRRMTRALGRAGA